LCGLVYGDHGLRLPGLGTSQPDPGGEDEQTLLCAVVQVPLDTTALGDTGLGSPGVGCADAGELVAQDGVQASVLDRQAGSRDRVFDQVPMPGECPVSVHESHSGTVGRADRQQ
jgi:hypothetical protein